MQPVCKAKRRECTWIMGVGTLFEESGLNSRDTARLNFKSSYNVGLPIYFFVVLSRYENFDVFLFGTQHII